MGEAIRPSGRIDIGGDDRAVPARRLVHPRARRRALVPVGDAAGRDDSIPLGFATDVDLQIRLRAFPMPGPPQSVMVDTGAGRFGPLTVGTDWQTLVVAIPRAAWRAGPNQIVLTFSRVGPPVQHRAAATRGICRRPSTSCASRCTTEPSMIVIDVRRARPRPLLPARARAVRPGDVGCSPWLGVGLGSPVLWVLAGPADTARAVRLVAGALVAYAWVRSARGASTPAWGCAAAGVGAGLLATMPWTGGPIGGGARPRRRALVVAGRAAGDVAGGLRGRARPGRAVARRPRHRRGRPDAAGG